MGYRGVCVKLGVSLHKAETNYETRGFGATVP